MGTISMAIARSAEASGATIRTGAAVRSIDVSGGHTVGVTLETGEEIFAPVVMSGAHPKTTVLDMVGAEHFPDDVAEDMRKYRTRGGSVKVNWVLSEPPRYEGVSAEDQDAARALRRGVLPVDRHARARVAGRLSRRAGRDPVPRGRDPVDDRLDADRRRHDDRHDVHPVRAVGGVRLAGGLARGVRRPLPGHPRRARAEREGRGRSTARCSRRRIWSGSSALSAARSSRASRASTRWPSCGRSPALAQYATPVDGLYLCGAGTHPGGGVMALGGHNAAQRGACTTSASSAPAVGFGRRCRYDARRSRARPRRSSRTC